MVLAFLRCMTMPLIPWMVVVPSKQTGMYTSNSGFPWVVYLSQLPIIPDMAIWTNISISVLRNVASHALINNPPPIELINFIWAITINTIYDSQPAFWAFGIILIIRFSATAHFAFISLFFFIFFIALRSSSNLSSVPISPLHFPYASDSIRYC